MFSKPAHPNFDAIDSGINAGFVRVFVSSTFHDMQVERDVLVRRTFPALRARMRERGVELTEIDLRWGVTSEQSRRGETIPICLSEIDRCRPFFLGLLGERYGRIVPGSLLTEELRSAFPVLAQATGRSLTDIEIMHGVLDARAGRSEALFFFRDPSWLESIPEERRDTYVTEGPDERQKLAELKGQIRSTGATVIEYASPDMIGDAVEAALGSKLDALFPESGTADPVLRAAALHEAYARDRLGLHLGATSYCTALDNWIADSSAPPILVTGASGIGKSALVANWLASKAASSQGDIVFAHFIGASPDSTDPMLLLRRLWRHLDRATDDIVAMPASDAALIEQLPDRLARGNAFAERSRLNILLALDGLDKLSSNKELQWLPERLPTRFRLLASALPGPAADAAHRRGWRSLALTSLTRDDQLHFIERSLAKVGKTLTPEQANRVISHQQAGNPLFLRTLLDELRVFGHHEALDRRIDWYLKADDIPALYSRVLERLEGDHGRELVRLALVSVWASRFGLEESEILPITNARPVEWSALLLGLGEALRDQAGRIALGHDYLRQAVAQRYLPDRQAEMAAHVLVADRFEAADRTGRRAEELPYQLRAAEAWNRLETALCDMDGYAHLGARGDLEQIGYWLPLMERGRDPEKLLCAAFAARHPDPAKWRAVELTTVNNLFDFFSYRGEFGDDALHLARQATDVAERLIDVLPAEASFGRLADVLRARGDLVGARQVEERAIELLRRHYGPERAETLYAMDNLAATLEDLGELATAQAMQERLLSTRERINGPHHRDNFSAMYNLAQTLRARGKFKAAQTLQRRVLDGMTQLFGPDHRETLIAIETLAQTHLELGEFKQTEQLERRVVETRTRVLGPEHPDTLAKLMDLAETLRMQGKRAEAQRLQEQALQSQVRQLGPEHPESLLSANQLALILSEQGHFEEALKLLKNVFDIRMRNWGPDRSSTRKSMYLLATTNFNKRDLPAARVMARRHWDASREALGPDAAETKAAARFHSFVVRWIWRRRLVLAIGLVGGPLVAAAVIANYTGFIDIDSFARGMRSWLGR